MLCLTRKPGDVIAITVPPGNQPRRIEVTLNWIEPRKAGIGIDAPQDVVIVREEIEGRGPRGGAA